MTTRSSKSFGFHRLYSAVPCRPIAEATPLPRQIRANTTPFRSAHFLSHFSRVGLLRRQMSGPAELALPTDVCRLILSFLRPLHLAKACIVARSWMQLGEGGPLWQGAFFAEFDPLRRRYGNLANEYVPNRYKTIYASHESRPTALLIGERNQQNCFETADVFFHRLRFCDASHLTPAMDGNG